ncbi:FAD-dependent monooxygenase [Micromonospora antibiotica]|uniref:FAD-dependent monooxygenase n=1 Tax=Micromonospora antibiotica TaxID=2807623 RepID=A0ABS3V291_9ACTN|nr:FAD-dependent monooxygenase [Micromonospora antibiotica]MBO4159731.1 FAD-dependent monooxygenase [Micromonospora antibiotica]
MAPRKTDVVIVGGSTVGLFTAMFLARSGVSTLLVERHPAPLRHPRAMGIGPRTVELLRTAGIADEVDRVCVDMSGGNLEMISTPTLAEADLPALARQAPPRAEPFRRTTPQILRGTCPQGRLDRVVIDRARALGARLEFSTELTGFEQGPDGVTVSLTGPPGPYEVTCDYLVAADGARSGVREALGIGVTGRGAIGDPLVSVLFQADLDEFTQGQPFVMCDITTPEAAGGLLPVDGRDEWLYVVRYSPTAGQHAEDFTPERCRSLIRAAVGRADLPVAVISTLTWQVRAALADRFRAARVFLAGDAAHVVPPVGAFGMNTGVADAHNLAWKIAHVLAGSAGPDLLATYEAERRPVARTALEQSTLRLADPSLHWATGSAGARRRADAGALHAPVVHLGYRYASTAVLDPVPALPSTEEVELDLDGAPGSRLPHRWLRHDGATVSTLDLVDYRLTLFAGPQGQAWHAVADEVSRRLGLRLAVHCIDQTSGGDPEGSWAASVGIDGSGVLLVRPDDFVAWRARRIGPASADDLEKALLTILSRTH